MSALTWQLSVTPFAAETRDQLCEFLHELEIFEFVEGTIDALDIDAEYGEVDVEALFDAAAASQLGPVFIYRFEKESLIDLQSKIEARFSSSVKTELASLSTKEWQDGWRESFVPLYIAEKLYLRAPWHKPLSQAMAHLIEVQIEPGMAFGTGHHETTHLCLCRLALYHSNLKIQGKSILDVGTGTGVLAIFAKKLGAGRVRAIDIDPDAILSAKLNAEVNQVQGLEIDQMPLDQLPSETFDIVIANILTPVLIRLSPLIAKRVMGTLLLSGCLTSDIPTLKDVYCAAGLKFIDAYVQNDWAAVEFKRE